VSVFDRRSHPVNRQTAVNRLWHVVDARTDELIDRVSRVRPWRVLDGPVAMSRAKTESGALTPPKMHVNRLESTGPAGPGEWWSAPQSGTPFALLTGSEETVLYGLHWRSHLL
jgi:hypothetical protein